MMNGKYIKKEGKETLYYMGCYGIGVSRTVAALYEQCVINDEKWGPCGFVLPKSVAPYLLQIIPKIEDAEKVQIANKLYNRLQEIGIDAILDDRENLTIGTKIKDSKVLGTPYLVVIGDKTEGEDLIIENNLTGEKIKTTLNEVEKILK